MLIIIWLIIWIITLIFLCILAESKTCASHAFSFISKRSIPLVTHLYKLTADISIYWLPYQVFAHDSSTKQTLTYSKRCSEGDLTAFHRSTFHPAKLAPGHHWKPLVKKTSQRIWLWVGWQLLISLISIVLLLADASRSIYIIYDDYIIVIMCLFVLTLS